MKRIISAFLTVVMLLSVVVTVSAETDSTGLYSYNVLSDGTVSLTHYYGNETVVSLPSQVDGKTVSQISMTLLAFDKNVTSVYIPETVRVISDYAFNDMSALVSVNIEYGVQTIGASAFSNCPNLSVVVIPPSVTAIGENVFRKASSDLLIIGDYNTAASKFAESNNLMFVSQHEFVSVAYEDVDINAWYYDSINFVYWNGLMAGTGDYTFAPNANMTRAQLVTVLWRMVGSPAPTKAASFTDLDANQSWYHDPVAWASENGIVLGTSETTFSPGNKITREQMAALLYRFCEYLGFNVSVRADFTAFPDASSVSSWATENMSWAVGKEYITGKDREGVNYLDPQGSATRAQVATILMRFYDSLG